MKKIWAMCICTCLVLLVGCSNGNCLPSPTVRNDEPVLILTKGASYTPWLGQTALKLRDSVLSVDIKNIYAVDSSLKISLSYDGGYNLIESPVVLESSAANSYGLFVAPNKTAIVYEKNELTYVAISNDKSKTWNEYKISGESIMPNCAGYFVQFIDKSNGWIVAESEPLEQEPHGKRCPNRVYRTYDGGLSWIETGNTVDAGFARQISGIGFSSKDIGFICFFPEYWIGPIVYRTLDGGLNWESSEKFLPGFPDQYDYITPLSPVFDEENGILPVKLSGGGTIYYTTKDYGLSWELGFG